MNASEFQHHFTIAVNFYFLLVRFIQTSRHISEHHHHQKHAVFYQLDRPQIIGGLNSLPEVTAVLHSLHAIA